MVDRGDILCMCTDVCLCHRCHAHAVSFREESRGQTVNPKIYLVNIPEIIRLTIIDIEDTC